MTSAGDHMTHPCRRVEELGPEFKLPHCQQIFNIFHPVSEMVPGSQCVSQTLSLSLSITSLTLWRIGWSRWSVRHLLRSQF